MKLNCFAGLLALLGLAPIAFAQTQNSADKRPLDPDQGVLMIPFKNGRVVAGGKVTYAEGTATATRVDRFGMEGLAVTQPVVVSVLPKDPKVRLVLSAGKGPKSPGKTTSTTGDGPATMAFRAQGDVRISVRAESGQTPYQLMVWAGPEIRAKMRAPFKPAKADDLRNAPKAQAPQKGGTE